MRVLIVEDDPNKSKQLLELIRSEVRGASIEECRSYQSGLKAILTHRPELIILDMSMPTFDISQKDRGGRTRAYGGRDILDEMKRRGVIARVIVVTQFETFGEGAERMTLSELRTELAGRFPETFESAIYYHPAESDWRETLIAMIRERPCEGGQSDDPSTAS